MHRQCRRKKGPNPTTFLKEQAGPEAEQSGFSREYALLLFYPRPFRGIITSMKSHTEYLAFNTKNRQEFVNITPQVEEALRKSGVKEGLCLVNAMHITASVFTYDENPMH